MRTRKLCTDANLCSYLSSPEEKFACLFSFNFRTSTRTVFEINKIRSPVLISDAQALLMIAAGNYAFYGKINMVC